MAAAVVLLALPLGYSYWQWRTEDRLLLQLASNPTLGLPESLALIDRVKKFDEVPKDETPTTVRVTDPSVLSSLGWVRRGDIVFLYPRAGRAVVFDSTVGRLMTIVPVHLTPLHEKP